MRFSFSARRIENSALALQGAADPRPAFRPGRLGLATRRNATRELLELNAAVHARLDRAGIAVRPIYRPGSFVPHCTLAMRPRSIDAAVRVALVADLPITATAVAMRVVEVPTGKVRATVA